MDHLLAILLFVKVYCELHNLISLHIGILFYFLSNISLSQSLPTVPDTLIRKGIICICLGLTLKAFGHDPAN